MKISDSITRIRTLLRDSNAVVFSDDFVMREWGGVMGKLVTETLPLERWMALPVPPTAQATYTHEWEREFAQSKASELVYNFISPYTYTQPWESGYSLDENTATGGYTITHGWESFYATPQNRVRHYFPDDLVRVIWAAYDEKPIPFVYRSDVEAGNTAFHTKSGDRPYIYVDDLEGGYFYLYPKVVGAYGITDVNSDYGEVGYDDSSDGELNPDSDYGCVIFSETESIDSDYGVSTYVQRDEDAIVILYNWIPPRPLSVNEEIQLPTWMVKYVEFGVVSRLLSAESDLKNLQLSKFFSSMCEAGKDLIKVYVSKRHTVRHYGLEGTGGGVGGRKKLASLPSNYPSYWR